MIRRASRAAVIAVTIGSDRAHIPCQLVITTPPLKVHDHCRIQRQRSPDHETHDACQHRSRRHRDRDRRRQLHHPRPGRTDPRDRQPSYPPHHPRKTSWQSHPIDIFPCHPATLTLPPPFGDLKSPPGNSPPRSISDILAMLIEQAFASDICLCTQKSAPP